MGALTVQEQRRQEATRFRGEFQRMGPELQAALPEHISVDKFVRIVLTAVNSTPALLDADRKSLFSASMKSAQDGLLPDGREGALVIFKNQVQWMPMIGGILKKVRNSGELLSITVGVACLNDKFLWVQGDDERIEHEPLIDGDRGEPRAAYAIAKTKSGGIYREVMSRVEIEKVRAVSRAGQNADGPWMKWWEEMAKKTVLRRLSKRLPMSTDLERVIQRDDEMFEFRRNGAEGAAGRLFARVKNPLEDAIEHDQETGEIKDPSASGGDPAGDQGGEDPRTPDTASGDEGGDGEASGKSLSDRSKASAPKVAGSTKPNGDSDPPAIDKASKDYERGYEDALKGTKKCLSEPIRSDPDRLRHWEAGHAAGLEQAARDDE